MLPEAPIKTVIDRWVSSTSSISSSTCTKDLKGFIKSTITLFKHVIDRFESDSKNLEEANLKTQELQIDLTEARETITNHTARIKTLQVAKN